MGSAKKTSNYPLAIRQVIRNSDKDGIGSEATLLQIPCGFRQ